jgi:transglutaminase-like putative cysteine protease
VSRLDKALRWSAGLNLLSAMAMVYFSEEFGLTVWGPVVLGLLVAARTGHKEWRRTTRIIVTTALLALFGVLLLQAFQTGNWLGYSVIFALAATVSRTLQTTNARQYFQVAVLSFLVMIAGSVLNPDITFAIFFLPYAITLTWVLLLTHIRQQVEDAGEDGGGVAWKASAMVRSSLFTGTSALALVLLLSSMAVFFLFPRLGLGFFSAQTRRSTAVSGFSDSIQLGHFGNIQDSEKVVLRVEFPDGRVVGDGTIRLTGITFETYTGNGWEKGQPKTWLLKPDVDSFFTTWWAQVWTNPGEGVELLEYDIYQEPMTTESRVLFGIAHVAGIRPVEARMDRYRGLSKSFYTDSFWNLTWKGPEGAALAYTVRTVVPESRPALLRESDTEDPEWISRFHLQLPGDLDPRIRELAEELTADAPTRYDKAAAVRAHLMGEYFYSTEGGHDPHDPLADFLFGVKAGHCEYFSTAMAVMLRSVGVPARSANGFLGGEYNEFGDYYLIRESDAHSWVEVFFPDYGWIPFDPTPPFTGEPGRGLLASLDLWYDMMRLQWFKWVVEFDLEAQVRVYARLWNALSPERMDIDLSGDLTPQKVKEASKKVSRAIWNPEMGRMLLGLLCIIILLAYGRRSWRRWRRRAPSTVGRRWERKVRKALARAGLEITDDMTLQHVAAQATEAGHPAAVAVAEMADAIDRLRWSRNPDVGREIGRIRLGLKSPLR